MKMPSDPKPKPREPYTQAEILQILAAPQSFGRNAYERLRARAMVLLLRYYGLRISDVATLRKDRIKSDYIYLHALKNGASIWLPLHAEVKAVLERCHCHMAPLRTASTSFGLGRRARRTYQHR